MNARAGLCLLPLLGGCVATDPYTRPGMWQPEGVNAANAAAMVERPSDLVRGRTDRTAATHSGRDAVERLWDGRVRPLPTLDQTGSGTAAPPASKGSL